jgi:predicted Zn-dependent peptidase
MTRPSKGTWIDVAWGAPDGSKFVMVRPVHRTSLANGLRVVVAPLPHLRAAYVGLALRGGPRFESARTSGLTHFVEHAVHAGTRSYPDSHKLSVAIESIGGDIGASTSTDDCILPLTLPALSLDEGSALLGEMVTRPAFDPDSVESERKRIIEEILGGGDDSLGDSAQALVFAGHPLARPVPGTPKTVKAFTLDDLRRWHRRLYTAKNSVLVFTGNVDPMDALRLARRDFGGMRPGRCLSFDKVPLDQRRPRFDFGPDDDDDTDEAVDESEGGAGDPKAVVDKSLGDFGYQTDLRICFRAPPGVGPVVHVLEHLLGDGSSARVYHRLADERGLCYGAETGLSEYEDAVYIEVSAESREPAAVVRDVLTIVDDLARRGPTAKELARVRRRIAWEQDDAADSIEATAGFYTRETLRGYDSTLEAFNERLACVTAEGVRGLARKMARPGRLSIASSTASCESAVRKVVESWRGWRR